MIFFYLQSNGLEPADSTFIASSQLTTSIHLPFYCTVHVFATIHFWDNILSFWVESNMCRFSIDCSFMYCRWRSNYQEEVVVIPITGVTPPRFCSCLKLGHGFPTSNLMIFFIFRWEVIARFVNHSGIFKTQQIKTNSMLRVRTIRSLVQGRIHKLKNCVDSRPKSVFKDQEAVKCLSSLHYKYFIVPADKASNNIVFVCKSYYFECIIKELGINSNTASNTTYKPTSFDKDEILANHRSFMSLRI
jgi:hypothetical protein